MIQRTSYIFILLGLFILSGIGTYFGNPIGVSWSRWILENGRWVLLLVNALFLVLAFRQMFIWNITATTQEVYLKRFMEFRKVILYKEDLISFASKVHKDPWWMKNQQTAIIIELQTRKGNFTFRSSDYPTFSKTLDQLFCLNQEMRFQCAQQISRLKSKEGI